MIGCRYRLGFIVFLHLAAAGVTAGISNPQKDVRKGQQPEKHLLLIQPRNLSAGVYVLMPGARDTTYSAAYQGRIGPRNYQRAEFRKAFPGGWRQFVKRGKKAASDHLKTLKPKYIRNSKKIIEYAVLESENPLTATTIVVDEFRDLFKETIGDEQSKRREVKEPEHSRRRRTTRKHTTEEEDVNGWRKDKRKELTMIMYNLQSLKENKRRRTRPEEYWRKWTGKRYK